MKTGGGSDLNLLDWLDGGLWDLPVWGLALHVAIVTHITIVTVTLYLHRHSAHRALDLHPVLQHFFRFWSWLTTGMITREWTAIHRKHHAMTETKEDPHSPQVQGIWRILWQGTEAYRAAAKDAETLERYGAGCPDDWLERKLYSAHEMLGVGFLAVLNILLFGFAGLAVWGIQMLWIPVLGAGVINGLGHYWGYRNFEPPDASTNMTPWGILIGGEELHNNHHAYPNSAKLSQKWWEFDVGWLWIRLFQACGLAQPKSTGPLARKTPGKTTLDIDTAWAVLNDRFRLMAKYKSAVVEPLIKQECARADRTTGRLFRNARKALCRDKGLVDESGQRKIDAAVRASQVIGVIYELRLRLQEIWAKRGGNAEELLQALRHWCRDAEATGIHALGEFVRELKSYTVPKLAVA